MSFFKKREFSDTELRSLASLCGGAALLVLFALVLVNMPPGADIARTGGPAATALGISQGVQAYNRNSPYQTTGTAPAYLDPLVCWIPGSFDYQNSWGFPYCNTSNSTFNAVGGVIPLAVFSVRPQGVLAGTSKVLKDTWSLNSGQYVYMGDPTCSNFAPWAPPWSYCGYSDPYSAQGTADCSAYGATYDAYASPPGCYVTLRPESNNHSYSTDTYGSAVSVPVSSTLTLEWSCFPSQECLFAAQPSGSGGAVGVYSCQSLTYYLQNGVTSSNFGASGTYGSTNVTAPATPGSTSYNVTCAGTAGSYNLSIPVTVTAAPTVSVSATDASAGEPSDTGTFTFTRSNTSGDLTVNFSVGGTALTSSPAVAGNPANYTSIGVSVVIPNGSASATKTVTPISDSTSEVNGTVVVNLIAGAGYSVGSPSNATVTIADDDAVVLPTVTVAATDASAGEPADTGTFTFTRTGSTAAALTVNFSVGGTALTSSPAVAGNPANYTSLGTSVSIPIGSASAIKTVTPVSDATNETSGTVVVTVSADAAYTVGSPSNGTVTITDDDSVAPPALASLVANPSRVRRDTNTTLTWTGSALPASCTLSSTPTISGTYGGRSVASGATGGSAVFGPINQNTAITLTCGTAQLSRDVTVLPQPIEI